MSNEKSNEKMRGSNFLASIFNWVREVIESAETPFSKLAIFTLPVLAPLVPAFMTSLHMYKLLKDLFDFSAANTVAVSMASLTGLVLELLGYVGAITFIRSLFTYLKHVKEDEQILPVILNGSAYLFYVIAMWLINIKLGSYFGTPSIVNSIFGILSFITVPTGLLAANHLSLRAEEEHEDKLKREQDERIDRLRREDKEYKLRRLELKMGKSGEGDAAKPNKKKSRPVSAYREQIFEVLNDEFARSGMVMRGIDIANRFNLDYHRSKGAISSLRTEWKKDHNVRE